MKNIRTLPYALALCGFFLSNPAFSDVVVDFNSGFNIGPNVSLNGQSASQPGLTGTWTAADNDDDPAVRDVTDLTNDFALPQTGTSDQVLVGGSSSSSVAYADLDTPLSGTTYFSFLARDNSNRVSGLALNPASTNVNDTFNVILVSSSDEVRLRNGGTNLDTGSAGAGDSFYVGRIDWNSSGSDDTFKLWVNPDTTTDFENITPALDHSTTDFGTDFSTLGVAAWSAGLLDNVRLGSSVGDVAVVPEPASFALILGLGCVGGSLFLRRRRRASGS